MKCIKLKDEISLELLKSYGFAPDQANCEHPEDRYYYLNNYYKQINKNFRVTINAIDRHIDILCLPDDTVVHNIYNVSVLYNLIADGLTEVVYI